MTTASEYHDLWGFIVLILANRNVQLEIQLLQIFNGERIFQNANTSSRS